MDGVPAISVPLCFAQVYRKHLEAQGALNPRFRMMKQCGGTVLLPILPGCLAELDLYVLQHSVAPASTCALTYIQTPVPSKKEHVKFRSKTLVKALQELLVSQGEVWSEELSDDIPHSWQRHGDLALLGNNCFTQEPWSRLGHILWLTVASELGVNRLARVGPVANDRFRTPAVTLLLGDDGWVTHMDNRIRYEFDVTKCMFSSGNVTEKLRIASFDCRGETIVDLYAGIGYFTLPYLVHCEAAHVHACEWNPHASEALRRNLELNGVSDRCTVHQGDNRQLQLNDVADRVSLGLIPSSEEGWPIACRVLKRSTGGILHIHQNVTSPPHHVRHGGHPCGLGAEAGLGEETTPRGGKRDREVWRQWAEETASRVAALLVNMYSTPWTACIQHIECVKSYAPHVNHLVLDLECRPG